MGLTEHTNICGWQIPPLSQHTLTITGTMAFIKHRRCVEWLKNVYQTKRKKKGGPEVIFGELFLGVSLLSEAAFTALSLTVRV